MSIKQIAKSVIATAALLGAAAASAQATSAQLEAAKGPLTTAQAKVATPNGYGSGDVYYPTTGGNYGLVVVAPGFTEGPGFNDEWGTKLASWGFVVVNIGTKTTLDLPPARATQMWAALQQVVALSKTASSPFAGKVDETRLAAMGHSMGGGGTLLLLDKYPQVKAGIPMAPWNLPQKNFPGIKVPTLIMACQNDIIAPVSGHADRFWNSLNATLPRVFAESKGQDHFCTTDYTSGPEKAAFGKIAISWYKVFLDGDQSYKQYLTSNSSPIFSRYIAKGL